MLPKFFKKMVGLNPHEAERMEKGFNALTTYCEELKKEFLQRFNQDDLESARAFYEGAKRIEKLSSLNFGVAYSFFYKRGLMYRWDQRPRSRLEKENAQQGREGSVAKIRDIITKLNSWRALLAQADDAEEPTERMKAGALRIEEMSPRELLADINYTNFQVVDNYLAKLEKAVQDEVVKLGAPPTGVQGQIASFSENARSRMKVMNSLDVDLHFWDALLNEIRLGGERDWYGRIQWRMHGISVEVIERVISTPFERIISPRGISESDAAIDFVLGHSKKLENWEGPKGISATDFEDFRDPEKYLNLLEIDLTDLQGTANEIQAIFKRKFRNAVRKYHPDLNPGNPGAGEVMKKILAFKELMDYPDQLRRYLKSH